MEGVPTRQFTDTLGLEHATKLHTVTSITIGTTVITSHVPHSLCIRHGASVP